MQSYILHLVVDDNMIVGVQSYILYSHFFCFVLPMQSYILHLVVDDNMIVGVRTTSFVLFFLCNLIFCI